MIYDSGRSFSVAPLGYVPRPLKPVTCKKCGAVEQQPRTRTQKRCNPCVDVQNNKRITGLDGWSDRKAER